MTLPSAIRRTHSRSPAAVWLARRSGWMRGLASALHPRAVHSVSYLDQHRRLPLCLLISLPTTANTAHHSPAHHSAAALIITAARTYSLVYYSATAAAASQPARALLSPTTCSQAAGVPSCSNNPTSRSAPDQRRSHPQHTILDYHHRSSPLITCSHPPLRAYHHSHFTQHALINKRKPTDARPTFARRDTTTPLRDRRRHQHL